MIGSLLRHDLVLVRDLPTVPASPDDDDRGHTKTTPTDVGTFAGLVQPRSARERASVSGSDVNVGSHRIYLEAAALPLVDVDDRIRKEAVDPDPDLAGTYRIVAVANAAGAGHHVELDADLIRP